MHSAEISKASLLCVSRHNGESGLDIVAGKSSENSAQKNGEEGKYFSSHLLWELNSVTWSARLG